MIWVVGSNGMLGSEVLRELSHTDLPYIGSDREVDILSLNAIASFAERNLISTIVNCAAYTAVDKAEDEPELSARLNIDGPANLAQLAKTIRAKLIHISTDYVFSGNASMPYHEDDPIDPQGVYGRTKAEGEKAIISVNPDAIILRTAWLYGEFGSNFVFTMLKLMRKKDEIGVVADQRGSPTWAQDLSRAIKIIIEGPIDKSGIYHFTNAGDITWYDFAVAIQEYGRKSGILEKECRIVPLTTIQYPTKARRPAYSVLSKDKVTADFKVSISPWEESLREFIEEISRKKDIMSARIS